MYLWILLHKQRYFYIFSNCIDLLEDSHVPYILFYLFIFRKMNFFIYFLYFSQIYIYRNEIVFVKECLLPYRLFFCFPFSNFNSSNIIFLKIIFLRFRTHFFVISTQTYNREKMMCEVSYGVGTARRIYLVFSRVNMW